MVFEYKCVDCGKLFTRESLVRGPAKRCPECNKIRRREQRNVYRKRMIMKELNKIRKEK